MKERARHECEIRDLNRRYCAQMANLMSEPERSEFMRHYRESAYSQVYPDPVDAAPTYKAMIEIDGLSNQVMAAMQMIWALHQREYDRISNAMEQECDAQAQYVAERANQGRHGQHAVTFGSLREERWHRCAETIRQLGELVPEPHLPEATIIINEYRARLADRGLIDQHSRFRSTQPIEKE